ncbi:MAG TPA: type 1 periplasmic binding fold superfamily protein, partial [bacterium]
ILALTFGVMLINFGCGDDKDPAGPDEEELITTVILTLTETGTTNQVTAQFEDLDGDGGNAPVIGTLTLGAGKTYTGTIQLLNESVNPAEDITEEVEAESDAHQFFFTAEGGIAGRVVVTITDLDANNLPIGLEYTVTVSAGAAASGTLNVVLGHFDEVAKDGVTRSPETDVDIDFPVNIQ